MQLRYGSHAEQIVDLTAPAASSETMVILLHGGFWRQRYDRHYLEPLAAALHGQGLWVANAEYRRVGGAGGWPETFDDVAALVDGLVDGADGQLAGQLPQAHWPSRVVLAGHSAGGQLAAWAASRHRLPADASWHRPAPPSIAGVVAIGGVMDLTRAAELELSADAVGGLLGASAGDARRAARLKLADPVALAPSGVPVTLVHGAADENVPLELAHRFCRTGGTPAPRLVRLSGVDHFQPTDPEHPAGAWTVQQIIGVGR